MPLTLSKMAILIGCLLTPFAHCAEIAILNQTNWDQWAPQGKEADCIYLDHVVRNQHLIAVIAQPVAGRNANMTVRNVAGAIIDLTTRGANNDQLSAFYPGAAEYPLRGIEGQATEMSDGQVDYRVRSATREGQPVLEVHYQIGDEPWVTIHTTYSNPHDRPIQITPKDSVRADRSFELDIDSDSNHFVAYDEWWHYAFAVVYEKYQPIPVGDSLDNGRPVLALTPDGVTTDLELPPGSQLKITRRLFVADSQLGLQSMIRQGRQQNHAVRLTVRDANGPVHNARVEIQLNGQSSLGRTDVLGQLHFRLPHGSHEMKVSANGRPAVEQRLEVSDDVQRTIELQLPGYVRASISDAHGRRIPCKVEFRAAGGTNATQDPYFGPDTYAATIHNLVYSANGQFRQAIAPGRYDVLISHGPEYDAVRQTIDVARGQDTRLSATMIRSVATPGWISSDFHSHSTPSGDNTSDQSGRVLNLLAEHIEFGPCTEHNRISTYAPHLQHFGAAHLMATCTGIELTGQPLPVNHQNAFPLVRHPRTQDGGGPTTDENPVVQVERLAFWDQRSQKVVQGNHPNLMQIYGDRDLDGTADGGFERMLAAMDVVEVHPPADIFRFPTEPTPPRERSNVIFHWLQLLNQGYRIPGVVNTDAHYNFHGSGWLRNYLKSPTDDPARITTSDMIRSAEAGHVVMTNGPYLEVSATSTVSGEKRAATAGDDLATDDGKIQLRIRVQCANWLDVNRVQLFFNGRPSAEHDYRRATRPTGFDTGVVKFEQDIELQLASDTHVVVATIGEGLKLGDVVGPSHQDDAPVAVANPIYVDVDANGFRPNGDTLGLALPN